MLESVSENSFVVRHGTQRRAAFVLPAATPLRLGVSAFGVGRFVAGYEHF